MESLFKFILLFWLFWSIKCDSELNVRFQQNFQDILEYYENRMTRPTTIMINIFESRKNTFEFEFKWSLFEKKPIIHTLESVLRDPEDYLILEKQIRLRWNGLYSFIVVYWIFDEAQIDSILTEIEFIVNPRRDRLIICGNEKIIQILSTEKIIQHFSEKILLDVEGIIFVDPPIYNSGQMKKISKITEKIIFPQTFGGNLHGRHIKFTTSEFAPWTFKDYEDSSGDIVVGGTGPKILQEVGKNFNFSYETRYMGWHYATQLENKTWIGQYSLVFYKKFGFHVSFHCHDISYTYGVDNPSYGLVLTPINILYIVPIGEYRLHWYAFLLPLEIPVWIGSILMFIFFGIVQYIIMYLRNKKKNSYLVIDTAYFVPFSLVMEQGLTNIPPGVRYTSLFLLLAGTVIGTGYRSTLRTNLSFPVREKIPLTVEALAERTDYEVTMYKYGAVDLNYIQKSQNSALVKIRQRLRYDTDIERCVRNAFLRQKAACLSWDVVFKQITALTLTINSQFEVMVHSTPIRRVTCNLVFQKNSIFADSFIGIVGGLIESNIYNKWENEVFYASKLKGREKLLKNPHSEVFKRLQEKIFVNSGESPLTFWSLRVVFAMIPGGIVLGLVLFMVELLYYKRYAFVRLTNELAHKINTRRLAKRWVKKVKTKAFSSEKINHFNLNYY